MLKYRAMWTASLTMSMALACATEDGGRGAGDPIGEDRGAGASLGTFEFTYYWVASEASYNGAKNTNVYDSQCTKLATVPRKFWDALKLEGTGKLNDGRLLNYAGPCGCARSPCFKALGADKPWGEGVQSRALEPYRSIAVDKTKIPYGSWMYIPELDGQVMPGDAPWGGWTHDGCVLAADTGSAIIGKHIDFFVGMKSSYTTLINELGLESVTVQQGGTLCTGAPPAEPGDGDGGGGDGGGEVDANSVCFPGADGSGTTCLPLAFPGTPTGYSYPSPLNANYRAPVAYLDLDAVDVGTKLSPNFTLGEFASRSKGRYAVVQPHAIVRMQELRDQLGSISVNSGYRSPKYNSSVGGASSSRHMFGDGFDFVGNNVSLTTAENACGSHGGFLVEYSSHVHCDWRSDDLDASFFGAVSVAHDDALELAAFTAHLHEDAGVWTAPAQGFDEGEPMRRWRALDAAGDAIVETTGESFVPPIDAVRLEVSVGAVVELAADLASDLDPRAGE
jgi:3D (Asp-Asp-Asp) domain-containing protein